MGHSFSNYFLFEHIEQDLILERQTGKLISVFCYVDFVQYQARSDDTHEMCEMVILPFLSHLLSLSCLDCKLL